MSHPAVTTKVVAVCSRHDVGFLVNVPNDYKYKYIMIEACDLGKDCDLIIVGRVKSDGTYTCSEHALYDISMSSTELTYTDDY
jgi:hypothetical protein